MSRHCWLSLAALVVLGVAPLSAKAGWTTVLQKTTHTMTDSTRLGCGEPGGVYVVPKVPHVPQPLVNAFDRHVFMIGTCKELAGRVPAPSAGPGRLVGPSAPPASAARPLPRLLNGTPGQPLPSLGVLPPTAPPKHSLGVKQSLPGLPAAPTPPGGNRKK